MGKKKRKPTSRSSKRNTERRRTRLWGVALLVGVAAVAGISYLGRVSPEATQTASVAPLPPGWETDWPPLPVGLMAGDPDLIYAAYAFAARNPEMFRYIPCYCGCEGEGHGGLLDCFVDSRSPEGSPRWDRMGFG